MKFSIFTVMLPEYPIERTISLLKECGYDGVEWRVEEIDKTRSGEEPSFWGNNLSTIDVESTEETLLDIRRQTEAAGLEVPNLACYLKPGDLAAVERGMRTALLLGAPSLRIGVPFYNRTRHYGELFVEARTYLQGVQELSRKYGIKGIIEIHRGNIATSASLAHRLVEEFDPACIGVILDPGNMVSEGYENYRMGLELIGDYLSHVHVKNTIWIRDEDRNDPSGPAWKTVAAPMAEGIVHWRQVIDDLRSVGYDGWLSFEDFSRSSSSKQLLNDNIQYLKSLL